MNSQFKSISSSLLIVILTLALLVLVACQPPAADTGDVATPTAQPAAPEPPPALAFDGVRGTCQGTVDVVAWGFPMRLQLDFQGDQPEAEATGRATVTTQLGALACELSTEGRRCDLGPGRVPFLPASPPAAAPRSTEVETDFDAE